VNNIAQQAITASEVIACPFLALIPSEIVYQCRYIVDLVVGGGAAVAGVSQQCSQLRSTQPVIAAIKLVIREGKRNGFARRGIAAEYNPA